MSGSLRTRLLLALGAASLVIWCGLAVWQYWQVRLQVDRLFDAHIAESAGALHGLLRAEAQEHTAGGAMNRELERFIVAELERHTDGPIYGRDHFYQVTFGRSAAYHQSAGAPALRLAADGRRGFRTREVEGAAWRVFTIATDGPEGPLDITVGEPLAIRTTTITRLAEQLGLALGAGLVLLGMLVLQAVAWGLRPLGALTAELSRRDPNHLQPLIRTTVPREVVPLVAALNALLGLLEAALESERQFTADAAHELRNPMAALKVQAQVAARTGATAQRDRAIAQVLVGVDRATRLVEQLLTLARVDPDMANGAFAAVSLHELAAGCLHEVESRAAHSGVTLHNGVPSDVWVQGDAGVLAIALHNLLDNALRYAAQGGRVEISAATTAAGAIELRVVDQGPGIAAKRRADVVRRFYRLPGASGSGSGIGLAIVARIARLHRAELEFRDAPGTGLAVILRFPPPRAIATGTR